MRNFLAFCAIFAACAATFVLGITWYVPLVGTLALWTCSPTMELLPRVHRLGFPAEAVSVYLHSLANAAMAIGASVLWGWAMQIVWGVH